MTRLSPASALHLMDRRAGAVLLTLAVSGLLLATTHATWVHSDLPAGMGAGARTLDVHGSDAAALVPALALVGVAGAAALSTLRGVGRVLAGCLVALSGAAAVASSVTVLAAPARAATGAVRTATGLTGSAPPPANATVWAAAAIVPALALTACGLGVMVRGGRWTTSARFEAPSSVPTTSVPPTSVPAASVPAASVPATSVGAAPRALLWDELSRGSDPTREPSEPSAGVGGMMTASTKVPERGAS